MHRFDFVWDRYCMNLIKRAFNPEYSKYWIKVRVAYYSVPTNSKHWQGKQTFKSEILFPRTFPRTLLPLSFLILFLFFVTKDKYARESVRDNECWGKAIQSVDVASNFCLWSHCVAVNVRYCMHLLEVANEQLTVSWKERERERERDLYKREISV